MPIWGLTCRPQSVPGNEVRTIVSTRKCTLSLKRIARFLGRVHPDVLTKRKSGSTMAKVKGNTVEAPLRQLQRPMLVLPCWPPCSERDNGRDYLVTLLREGLSMTLSPSNPRCTHSLRSRDMLGLPGMRSRTQQTPCTQRLSSWRDLCRSSMRVKVSSIITGITAIHRQGRRERCQHSYKNG